MGPLTRVMDPSPEGFTTMCLRGTAALIRSPHRSSSDGRYEMGHLRHFKIQDVRFVRANTPRQRKFGEPGPAVDTPHIGWRRN